MSARRFYTQRLASRRMPAGYAARRVGGFYPKHTQWVGASRFPFFDGRGPTMLGNDGAGGFVADVRIKISWKRRGPDGYGTRFSIYPNTLVRNRHKWRHPRNQFSLPKPERGEDYDAERG